MNRNTKFLALGIAIIAIVSVYYIFFSQEVVAPVTDLPAETVEDVDVMQPSTQSVSVHRSYAKGVHTVEGVITLPTPCYTLATQVEVSSSSPSVATIYFSSGDPGGMCIQVIDERAFKTTFKGAESVTLKGIMNGTEIALSEAGE